MSQTPENKTVVVFQKGGMLKSISAATMLLFVIALVLCLLYASDTIIISHCYRTFASNPSSAKLLLLAEAVKLSIAGLLHFLNIRTNAERSEGLQRSTATLIHLSDTGLLRTSHPCPQNSSQQRQGSRHLLLPGIRTLMVFSVPSICYFATNNLSFYALTLLSTPLYTLLCDLKLISTGLLTIWIFHKQLSTPAVVSSLLGLFLGICLGQQSTMRATSGSLLDIAAGASLRGCLLMLLISLLSAAASVYTEWVMNHSQYSHETLKLQNVRLYSIGVLLNAGYYWHSGGQLEGFLSDMQGPHWAVVMVLALMGLITGALIKHWGNITKVYISAVASLFAAWVSQLLLHKPPPPLFYGGVCLALAASVQLQKSLQFVEAGDDSSRSSKSGRWPSYMQQQQQRRLTASLVVPIALAFLVMLFVPQMMPSGDGSYLSSSISSSSLLSGEGDSSLRSGGSSSVPQPQPPANPNNPTSLLPQTLTGAPMPVLPPFAPTCLVAFENSTQLGCYPMNCSLSDNCTIGDQACCAFYNYRMLEDVSRILRSKGLAGEFVLVYGSALGAALNSTVLGSSHSVDIALSPTALQILAQNSTRELLWRHGYVFWHDHDLWRMCPHEQHPSTAFWAAMMLPKENTTQQQQQEQGVSIHLDAYLMWSLPVGVASCTAKAHSNHSAQAAILMQPLAPVNSAAARAMHSPGSLTPDLILQQQQLDDVINSPGSAAAGRTFCLQQSQVHLVVKAGAPDPGAAVGNLTLPVPVNLKKHLDSTYGSHWMALNSTHQQTSQQDAAPDWRVIQEALLARLAVTAWGDVPWEQREQQCEARPAEGGAAVPAATDEDAEAAAAAAEGAWGSQSPGSAAASKHASGAGAPAGSDMLAKGAATADAPAGEDVLAAGLPDAAAAAVSTFAAAAESAREEDAGPAAGQLQHVGDGDTAAVSALVAADAGRVGGVRKEDSEPQQVPGRSKQEVRQGAGAALPAAAAETMAAAADQPAEGDAGRATGQPLVGGGDTAAVVALVAADEGPVGGVEKESEPLQVPGRGKQAVLQELAGEFGIQRCCSA